MAERLSPTLLSLALLSVMSSAARVSAVALERGEPFSATAETLLAAAGDDGGGEQADARVLLEEVTVELDTAGRRLHRRWRITHLRNPGGVAAFAGLAAEWRPWLQERPAARVRIVRATGEEESLEAPASERPGGDTSRTLVLEMPLPELAPGAVVEEVVITRDHRPYFTAGAAWSEPLGSALPTRYQRLVLEAPTGLPLRYGARRLPGLEPERKVEGERVRLVFEVRDLPALAPLEPGIPPAQPRRPQVDFSTGRSWRAVAAAYAEKVDRRLIEAGLEASVEAAESPATGTERIARELAALRREARPTAAAAEPSELGPGSLPEVLRRGTGGAEELAALAVGRLRSAGVPAFVALVRAGFDKDVDPNLPGLGPFNHALAYVPATPPIWIDPSDPFSRAGELPIEAQGRLALVASAGTRELVRTPASESFDNRSVLRVEVYLAEEGPAFVVEESEYFGSPERTQRRLLADLDEESRRRAFEAYVGSAYRAEELGRVELGDPYDLSQRPFRLRLEALGAGRARTEAGEAAVAIPIHELLALLPSAVLSPLENPRRNDFLFHEPFLAEWRYRIVPPAGFAPRTPPEGATLELGTARLERRFELEGGALRADFRLDSGPRLLSAEQFDELRRAVQGLLEEETLVLWWERPSGDGQR